VLEEFARATADQLIPYKASRREDLQNNSNYWDNDMARNANYWMTIGALIFAAFASDLTRGGTNSSAPTGSVIPSSGDSIKAGDIVYFRSDAPILKEVFPDSEKKPAIPKQPSAEKPSDPTDKLSAAADKIAAAADKISAAADKTNGATKDAAQKQAPVNPAVPAKVPAASDAQSATLDKLVTAVDKLSAAAEELNAGKNPPVEKTFCAPAFSRFEVQSVTPAASKSATNATGKATGTSSAGSTKPTPADTQVVIGSFPSASSWFHSAALPNPASRSPPSACYTADANLVIYDTPYQFTSDDFAKVNSQRMGFTYGAMVIPYKFYFTDKSFRPNPSTVAFAGYEGYFPGVSLAGVLALGPGVASTSQTSSQPTTTPSKTAPASTNTSGNAVTYTAAVGFIATFAGSIKGGILFGRDWQGSGSGFKYENKTWMALSIGTSF
jgi:hypothetical protein